MEIFAALWGKLVCLLTLQAPCIATAVIVFAVVAANLPWLSERILFVIKPKAEKHAALRLLEWLLLYFVTGAVAMGLEQRLMGQNSAQGWEFYAATFALFMVFALPGFIWRFGLRKLLRRRKSAQ